MGSDVALLEAWRGGDKRAGEALFERHFDSVNRFFRHKVERGADDLVQRTFLACVEGRDRLRDDASFRGYLFGVARNLLYKHFRDKARDKIDFTTTTLSDLEPSTNLALRAEREQRLLLEALRRIPLDLQIVVELYYWEKMRGPELAAVLDIPEGTVRSRLRRARELLRAQLEELSESDEVLQSTLSGLDDWAASLRELE